MKNRVLILAPDFYDYTRSILETVRSHGIETDFFDTRPTVNGFQKARMRRNRKFNNKILEHYKDYIISATKDKTYALIIVIACVTFDKQQLKEILDFHHCKKIFYMWDSFCNYPQTAELLPLFDKNYSFDPVDCQAYDMTYQPTFYSRNCLDYEQKFQEGCKKNDVFFIASYLPQRYEIFTKFLTYAKRSRISFKYHFYVKSYFTFLYFKLNNLSGSLKRSHFSFKQMSESEKLKNIDNAKCVLDVPFGNQAGLTMRILEAIVLNKKIITTNQFIKSYDFYRSDMIAVISENDFSEVTEEFINQNSGNFDVKYREVFSVDHWVMNIIIDNL